MDSRIKVIASASVLNYSGGDRFLQSLERDYSVSIYERFSKFDGTGDPFEDIITKFTVVIASKFIDYIREYIIDKGGKYVFKELLFKPFLEKLEKFSVINENMPLDRLVFQYDDITIWVGYARTNNVNVVSLMSVEVMKRLPALRQAGAGDLKIVASPLIRQGMDWKFVSEEERQITGFTENWGLDFNFGNRLVFHVQSGKQTDAYWWD